VPRNRTKSKSYIDTKDEDDEPLVVTRKTKKRLSVVDEVGEPSNNFSYGGSTVQHKESQAPGGQRRQKIAPLSANRDGEEDIPDSKAATSQTTSTRKRITSEASKTRIRKKVLNVEAVPQPNPQESSRQVTEDLPVVPLSRIEKPNLRIESTAEIPRTETGGNTTYSQSESNARSGKRRRQGDDLSAPETTPLPLKRRKSTDDAFRDVLSPSQKSDYEESKFIKLPSKKANNEHVDDPLEKRERPATVNAKTKKSESLKGSVYPLNLFDDS
jgi:hypothetical protein